MKRVIVDYAKLTGEILNLLVEKFPDGYDDSDIIRFKNAKNETIEAVEVKTIDTIFLVKISLKLSDRIINYDEDDELAEEIEDPDSMKDLDDIENDDDDDDDTLEKAEAKEKDDTDYDDEDDIDSDESNNDSDDDDDEE